MLPGLIPSNLPSTFSAIKEQVLSAINEQLKKGVIPPDPKGYTLIEGIINMPLQQELRGTFLGGPAIPTVAVVGNSSGIIYTFALKAILPSVNL